jgi:hypothetical protein
MKRKFFGVDMNMSNKNVCTFEDAVSVMTELKKKI